MKQNVTEMVNEQNLTNEEQTLLEVMLNPESRMKSVTEICKLAKIERATYYKAFQKPEFVEIYKQKSIDMVKQSAASILNTFIQEAQQGSFRHGKVILEMAGLYAEKSNINVSGQLDTGAEKLNSILEQINKHRGG
ncbi:MAG: phBC6A51 family helix-turn-helix protein [Mobilitalea sp.]